MTEKTFPLNDLDHGVIIDLPEVCSMRALGAVPIQVSYHILHQKRRKGTLMDAEAATAPHSLLQQYLVQSTCARYIRR